MKNYRISADHVSLHVLYVCNFAISYVVKLFECMYNVLTMCACVCVSVCMRGAVGQSSQS